MEEPEVHGKADEPAVKKPKIALIGFGSLNRDVFKALSQPEGSCPDDWAYDIKVFLRSRQLRKEPLPDGLTSVDSVQRLLDWRPDLIIEAASPQAVRDYVPLCLSAGCTVLVASVSAFVDPLLSEQIFRTAQRGEGRILIPSGAIGGLDYLVALKESGHEITLAYQARKPLATWSNELRAQGVDPETLVEPYVMFQGTAQQAIERFSTRLNVAATLALVGAGMQKTLVQVVVDPALSANEHHVKVTSPLGQMSIKLVNEPSPTGAGTSWIVAQSIIAAVKKRFNSHFAIA